MGIRVNERSVSWGHMAWVDDVKGVWRYAGPDIYNVFSEPIYPVFCFCNDAFLLAFWIRFSLLNHMICSKCS